MAGGSCQEMEPAVDFSPRRRGSVRRAGAEKLAGPKRPFLPPTGGAFTAQGWRVLGLLSRVGLARRECCVHAIGALRRCSLKRKGAVSPAWHPSPVEQRSRLALVLHGVLAAPASTTFFGPRGRRLSGCLEHDPVGARPEQRAPRAAQLAVSFRRCASAIRSKDARSTEPRSGTATVHLVTAVSEAVR